MAQKEEPPPAPLQPLDTVVEVEDEAPEAAPLPVRRTFLTVNAIGGAGVGLNIIPIPAPYAGPWAGFGFELERRVGTSSFLSLRGDLSLGSSESGRPIGGYQLLAQFGTAWINSRFFVWETEARGGITSVLLFPLPLIGGVSSVMLQPWRGDVFRFRLGVDLGLDFLIILPVFSSAVYSELRWDWDRVHFGIKVGGATSVGLPALGGSVSAKFFGGVSF